MTILLVRHAHAGSRSAWDGSDLDRPLSERGREQADGLTDHLAGRAVDRVLSSAAVRCQQTVAPLARSRGLEVETHPALTEGARADETTNLVWQLASDGARAVLASHGDVIPAALRALADDGVAVDASFGLPKGTYYELEVVDGAVVSARFVDPRPAGDRARPT